MADEQDRALIIIQHFLQQIERYKQEIAAFKAETAEAAEAFRIKFLGAKGLVKNLMGEMKNVPAESRASFGQVMNAFKQFTEEKFATMKEGLNGSTGKQASGPDLTLPGDPERKSRTLRQKDGIPISDGTWGLLAKLAQELGTAWGRGIHQDFWLKIAAAKIAMYSQYGSPGAGRMLRFCRAATSLVPPV